MSDTNKPGTESSKQQGGSNEDYETSFAKGNQLIGVACGLLKFRGWKQARYILNLLEEKGVNMLMLMSSYQDLRVAIIALIDWKIHGLYKPLSPQVHTLSPPTTKVTSDTDKQKNLVLPADQELQLMTLSTFAADICSIISYIGYHICEDPLVSARLCMVLKAHIADRLKTFPTIFTSNLDANKNSEETLSQPVKSIITVIANALLPGLSVRKGINPFLASQIYSTLYLLPFPLRFCAYDIWRGSKLAKEGVGTKPSELSLAETKVCLIP